eukprot:994876-Lingulodinium_polyedra.AAC.1
MSSSSGASEVAKPAAASGGGAGALSPAGPVADPSASNGRSLSASSTYSRTVAPAHRPTIWMLWSGHRALA